MTETPSPPSVGGERGLSKGGIEMRGFIDLKDRRGALRRVIAPMAGAGLLALLLIASGPAASAGSGNGSVKIHVQPTSGPPGTLIKVQGSGFGRICGIGISFT